MPPVMPACEDLRLLLTETPMPPAELESAVDPLERLRERYPAKRRGKVLAAAIKAEVPCGDDFLDAVKVAGEAHDVMGAQRFAVVALALDRTQKAWRDTPAGSTGLARLAPSLEELAYEAGDLSGCEPISRETDRVLALREGLAEIKRTVEQHVLDRAT